MTTTYDPELSDIVEMANDMEAVENLIGHKGRFVGDMVHISIADLAEISRTKLSAPEITLNQWQDISTAPKDGTEIIVLFTSGAVERVLWDEGDDDELPAWCDFQDLTNSYVEKYIIGWMPLPTPPEN